MDFALNDEQREYKDYVRRFAREVIRPAAPKHDADESTPWEVIKEARKWGLQGLDYIQRTGQDPDGQLGDHQRRGAALGLRRASPSRSPAPASPPPASRPRARPSRSLSGFPQCFGTDDEIKLGAYAVTEPQAGSDVKSLRTTAKLDGDEWVLNGTKIFITNGGIADVHVVVATVDPELGHRGQASFVIGTDTPGLRQGNKETKIGIRASHTGRGDPRGLPDPRRAAARRHGQARTRSSSAPARARTPAPRTPWRRSR